MSEKHVSLIRGPSSSAPGQNKDDAVVTAESVAADSVVGKTIKTDAIVEKTPGAGVTIEGLLVRDGRPYITAPRVEMIITDNTLLPTTIHKTKTWYTVQGLSTNSVSHPAFTHTGNRITYIGNDRVFLCGAISLAAATLSGNNQFCLFAVARDGVPIPSSIMLRRYNNPTPDIGSISINFMLTLTTGQYIEPIVQNTTGVNDILVQYLNMSFMVPPSMELVDIP